MIKFIAALQSRYTQRGEWHKFGVLASPRVWKQEENTVRVAGTDAQHRRRTTESTVICLTKSHFKGHREHSEVLNAQNQLRGEGTPCYEKESHGMQREAI